MLAGSAGAPGAHLSHRVATGCRRFARRTRSSCCGRPGRRARHPRRARRRRAASTPRCTAGSCSRRSWHVRTAGRRRAGGRGHERRRRPDRRGRTTRTDAAGAAATCGRIRAPWRGRRRDRLRSHRRTGAALDHSAGHRPAHRDGRRRRAGPYGLAVSRAARLPDSSPTTLQTTVRRSTGQHIMHRLRTQVYEHLQRLGLAYYDRHPVGRLMTRVTTDVDALNDLFPSGVMTVFGDLLVLVGIMAAMLLMNWRLALVAFTVLPFMLWRRAVVPARRARVLPAGARPRRPNQCLPAGAPDGHGRRAALPAGGARFAAVRSRQPEHRDVNIDVDLLLRGLLSDDRSAGRALRPR